MAKSILENEKSSMYGNLRKLLANGYYVIWAIGIAWVLFAAYATFYWVSFVTPVSAVSDDLSPKGKPNGVMLDELRSRQPVNIQDAAKGHWTLVVFTVFGSGSIYSGYQIGGRDYVNAVNDVATQTGEVLGTLHDLLPKDTQVWIVRLDPDKPDNITLFIWQGCHLGGSDHWCGDRYFTAAYNRGGRYGNYYDETYKWLQGAFLKYIQYDSVTHDNLPSYAILDQKGNLRTMRGGVSPAAVYSDFMALTGGKVVFDKEDPETPSFREPSHHWFDVYPRTLGDMLVMAIGGVMFVGLLAIFL